MPAEDGVFGSTLLPSGSGLWMGLRGWATEVIVSESTWQLCSNLFRSHCLVLSDLCDMCFWQDRGEGLVALKFGDLGEGASGALLGEQVDRLGVLWSLGESCGSCIC